ncbi:MAG: hypothetical protein F4Y44_00215, partial [Chloroflexi bacterium]|nr:hypothetical protein [Chloroflexota bacterium]
MIYSKEYAGREWEVILPIRDTLADYAENIAEAIAVLSTVEERSQMDVYYDLLGMGSDIIRVRSLNGMASQRLSLRSSAELLNDTYGMIASAARAAEETKAAYRGSMSSEVVEYLDRVHPLPGLPEGYGITLHSPVPAGFGTQGDFGDDVLPPFPRQVTTKLASALKHSELAVSDFNAEGSLEPFLAVVDNGVSANLCNSVAELAKNGRGVDIDLTWADVRPVNVIAYSFRFSESSADILAEAAKIFSRRDPSF